ncbi:hypothetical protein RUM44_005610 [Polyplax serrata]|uniref:Uncharacterized protein n=1 Tax=Polyplax serrata TaxID=468196 RepID=A0ABR1ADV2_POLSC
MEDSWKRRTKQNQEMRGYCCYNHWTEWTIQACICHLTAVFLEIASQPNGYKHADEGLVINEPLSRSPGINVAKSSCHECQRNNKTRKRKFSNFVKRLSQFGSGAT